MDLLPVNFYILRFCGVWEERKNDNSIVRFVSFCYRYTVAAILHHCAISEVIELVRMRNDVEDLTESLFLVLTVVSMCLKYLNVLVRQCELRDLLDCFRSKLCQPKDSVEESILRRYDFKAKRLACVFMFLAHMSGLLIVILPLISRNERRLPMKMYVPYSMVELFPYLFTYLEQAALVFYGVSLNVALDSLVYGLVIQTCGQIDLLCYRLSETFRFLQENNEEKKFNVIEQYAIAECVRHHVSVYNIVHRIQSLFMWIVATLFFFTLITLCSSIYQMSNKKLFSVEFFVFLVYLGFILFQIFAYCWYGNELDLKILKTSYSAFNLLQQA